MSDQKPIKPKMYKLKGKPKMPHEMLDKLLLQTYGDTNLEHEEAKIRFNHAAYRWELADRKRKS